MFITWWSKNLNSDLWVNILCVISGKCFSAYFEQDPSPFIRWSRQPRFIHRHPKRSHGWHLSMSVKNNSISKVMEEWCPTCNTRLIDRASEFMMSPSAIEIPTPPMHITIILMTIGLKNQFINQQFASIVDF